ncbi:hypothetical protein [Micromonospora sp. NPDC050200]|uniref:hypothetical protein n=1 Tax=Micromonospora sp. NPDC050200 TaxID=3155664 RepID=UPI0033E84190
MARVIGEGLIRVRPDTGGFGGQTERELTSSLQRVVSRLEGVLSRLEATATRSGERSGRNFAGGVERGANRIRTILQAAFAVGGVVAFGGGLAYAGAQAFALAAAVSRAGGSVLALPAAMAAAAVSVGVLAMATAHLTDALSDSAGGSGGGGAAAARAAMRAYEAGQRRIADAQRDLTRATRDLNDARREEAERIAALAGDVEGAALAEERAKLNVEQAERELAEARAAAAKGEAGAADRVREAELALREQQHAAREATARHAELAAEQQQAARVGVEGSRQVQDALQRQADAAHGVEQARKDAADAEQEAATKAAGAISKQQEAYAKLAPSARSLVDTLRRIAPAWQDVQRHVQQRVWAGVAGQVDSLSRTYLPVATNRLGQFGDAWNRAIRESLGVAQSAQSVRDVDTTLGNAAVAGDRLAQAVAPFVSALISIGAVGSTVLPELGGGVLNLAERFERWVAAARESGQLEQWLRGGLEALRQLGAIGANVVGIVVAILRGGGADAGGDMLAGLEAGTRRLREFLNSAEGQERISTVLTTIRDVGTSLIQTLPDLVDNAAKLGPVLADAAKEGGSVHDAFILTDEIVGFLADHVDLLADALPVLIGLWVASRVAQTGANIAAVASLPIRAAEAAATFGLRSALTAHTAALTANTGATRAATGAAAAETAATNGGILAKLRNVTATVASRAAAIAANVATKTWAVGQWLLNAALTANPIGLIILAIVALVAAVVLAYRNSETFRNIVQAALRMVADAGKWMWEKALKPAFDGIVVAVRWVASIITWWYQNIVKPYFTLVMNVAKWLWQQVQNSFNGWKLIFDRVRGWIGGVKDFVVDRFTSIVSFVKGLPGRISSAARGMFDGVVATAKGGINKLIDAWNRLDFWIDIRVPDWVPGIGGKGFHVDDIIPDIPRLADGGVARARPGGILAQIAEGGQDEVVAPLSTLAAMIVAAVREALGDRAGTTIEKVEVRGYTDRFSLSQVMDELALAGAH